MSGRGLGADGAVPLHDGTPAALHRPGPGGRPDTGGVQGPAGRAGAQGPRVHISAEGLAVRVPRDLEFIYQTRA